MGRKGAIAWLGLVFAICARAEDLPYERIDATVPMSDGVSLDASLYLPKSPAFARLPLIVRHHGGGSNKDSPFDVKYALKAVETGRFAALMYSVRGHGNSGGMFDFFGPRTTRDFSEMVDWVFWTNGWEDQLFPADHPQKILDVLEAAGIPVHYWFASGGHAAGDSFPQEEAEREQAMQDWFDQFLNGADHGFLSAPKVDYWERQSGDPRKPGDWLHFVAGEWPVPEGVSSAMFPQADGSLGPAPASDRASMTLINDYASANVSNDALTLEVASNVPGLDSVLEQLPENANPLDTLRSTSEPLAAALDVVGAPIITIAQDSTRTIVQQFDVKVWDQSDAGFQLIWRGAISGPLGLETSFSLWPNAHRFDAGHRIVLMISSVDFPTFKPDVEPWITNVVLAPARFLHRAGFLKQGVHAFGHPAIARGVGMDLVGLEAAIAQRFRDLVAQQRQLEFRGERFVAWLRVQREQLRLRHAEQDDRNAAAADLPDHRREVVAHRAAIHLVQHVVAAEAQEHQRRMRFVERGRQPLHAIDRRFARHARVDHRAMDQLGQVCGIRLVARRTVAGRETVAEREHDGVGVEPREMRHGLTVATGGEQDDEQQRDSHELQRSVWPVGCGRVMRNSGEIATRWPTLRFCS